MPEVEKKENEMDAAPEPTPLTEAPDQPPVQSAAEAGNAAAASTPMDFILDIPLEIRVELGRTRMVIDELLKLGQGSVIELAKNAGENLEVLANDRLIAKGEVVVSKEKYGIRLTEIVSPMERVAKLK